MILIPIIWNVLDYYRLKGDKELKPSDNLSFEDNEDTHAMIFKSVANDDGGLYTARAINSSGQMACNGRLKITRKTYL